MNLIYYLTQRVYRVKIKTWGDGFSKYYPQYRYRLWPWWCHFAPGQFIEVYSNEDLAWAIILTDKRSRHMKHLVKTTYKYIR